MHQNFNSLDEYFNVKIFKERYFKLPEDDAWQNSFLQRKLENMENDFSIFKIEDTMYLTKMALESAKIEKSTLISYRESVEEFVSKNQYFTLVSLKKSGFHHLIDDFGFESLFYESLLKRPGRLKSLKICGQLFFIKTPLKVDLSHFLTSLFTTSNQSVLSVDNIIEQIHDTFGIKLNFEAINNLLKSSSIDQYYSDALCKLFLNKNDYLDYIQ
ncbi:DNA mismatch repair MutH/Type II restriction enzyme Sau3AI domain-containing protein OS=Lysinibacillus sphaericus OX=1421 GN=LS41612_04825 PE=4 SV=1 [Lysinibacillus sphaericus]